MLDPFEVLSLGGILKDEYELMLFSIHLGLVHASSKNDESPWIEP